MTTQADAALTWAEQELCTAFNAGLPLDLTTGPARPGPGGGPINATGTLIHAWMIRDLLLCDKPVAEGRIRQLSVTGASIRGELDLRFARSDCPLRLEDCTFDSPVTLSEAHLRSVSLRKSTIPGIDARHVTIVGDLVLDDVRLSGRLQLSGAHLGDDLHLARATIDPPAPAVDGSDGAVGHDHGDAVLDLENIEVRGSIDAREITVHGKVSTVDATVAGPVRMMEARLLPAVKAPAGAINSTVWSGDGMKVEGSLDASGLRASGQVRLVDTRVLLLVFRNVRIENRGTALILDRLQSEGSAFCDQESDLIGGLHAIGIQVGATLYLGHGKVSAPTKGTDEDKRHAVDLRRARIAGELKCTEGFRAIGTCNLSGAHIGGRVSLPGATLRFADGTADHAALIADGARMDGNVHLSDGFTCHGGISLVNAQVGGEFTIKQKQEGHVDGRRCTLAAAGLSVSRDVNLDGPGKVDLSGADIAGDLTLGLAGLAAGEDHAAAANLGGLSADTLTLRGRPDQGLLDLTRTKVSLLCDRKQDWEDIGLIVLEGFEYRDITAIDARSDKEAYRYRLTWLERGTRWAREQEDKYVKVEFTPQPYQQLAEVYRRAGKDREARRVLHEMYSRRAGTNKFWSQPVIKVWNGAQEIFVGYGYRPDLAFAWVIGLAVGAALLFGHISQHRTGVVQEILMSLGLLLPESAYDKIEPWKAAGTMSHVVAAVLVLCGLLLSATVIAAVARVIKE
jgi:hypothetical protein